MQCRNGNCIPKEWKCDGDDDCGDSSDEKCRKLSLCSFGKNVVKISIENVLYARIQLIWQQSWDFFGVRNALILITLKYIYSSKEFIKKHSGYFCLYQKFECNNIL